MVYPARHDATISKANTTATMMLMVFFEILRFAPKATSAHLPGAHKGSASRANIIGFLLCLFYLLCRRFYFSLMNPLIFEQVEVLFWFRSQHPVFAKNGHADTIRNIAPNYCRGRFPIEAGIYRNKRKQQCDFNNGDNTDRPVILLRYWRMAKHSGAYWDCTIEQASNKQSQNYFQYILHNMPPFWHLLYNLVKKLQG
nr:MAG TPA: hypothetical protein [Caudoviricetes sp.]